MSPPFYANWPVLIRVLGKNGIILSSTLPTNLKSILPETSDNAVAMFDLSSAPTGELILQIGIPNPLKSGRPLRFANADSEPITSGWLTLGKIALE